ncbi:hypothetical protein J2S19_000680 [Metabacillus malikii]|uniref:Uncharacterized protein n=1 Tax=Metabacillus malikii TaxID=1504265 RepID=A0ABT9ZBY3_9BACI|nr:hypothetical protein [Metabacillus malikii]
MLSSHPLFFGGYIILSNKQAKTSHTIIQISMDRML